MSRIISQLRSSRGKRVFVGSFDRIPYPAARTRSITVLLPSPDDLELCRPRNDANDFPRDRFHPMTTTADARTDRLDLADATLREWEATVLDCSDQGIV